MGVNDPEPGWKTFARKQKAELKFFRGTTYRSKKQCDITRKNDFRIEFKWSLTPRRGRTTIIRETVFYFFLEQNVSFFLNIYKNDLFTKIVLLFSRAKVKTGDPDIDREFMFTTNRQDLLQSLSEDLRTMKELNSKYIFTLEVIDGAKPFVYIFVNALLKEKEEIDAFFQLGKALQQKISRGY